MLILASNSPRRKQLLALGGWDFTVFSPEIDESVLPDETPADYVQRLARDKALSVKHALLQTASPNDVILSADTAVVAPDLPGQGSTVIFGKPSSPDEAINMLQKLCGKTHLVMTGLVLLRMQDGMMLSKVVVTAVEMRNYNEQELLAYVATGDPMDKAGAYAIQSQSFQPVQNLQGCYANVMGLPVCHVARLLSKLDLPPAADIGLRCERALGYRCGFYDRIRVG